MRIWSIATEEYLPMKFAGEKSVYVFWVLKGATPDQLVAALAEHYKP